MGGPPRTRAVPPPSPSFEPAEPTTLRPPEADPEEEGPSNYEMLRDSCRATEAAEPVDDELAIEAEVVRVALDRESQRVKKE